MESTLSPTSSSAVPITSQITQESEQQNVDLLFFCKFGNASILSNLLNTISFKKGQMCTVTINARGLKFTVEECRTLQANVFLQEDMFDQFQIQNDSAPVQFTISLPILLDCLNIFGSNSQSRVSLEIAYRAVGSPIILVIKEVANVDTVTQVNLRTLESEGIVAFNFRDSLIMNKVIMQSTSLKEAFNELDWSSPETTLLLSPDPPHFRLSTCGAMGSCQVDFPKDSEAFQAFESKQTQANSYKLSLLQPCIKGLNIATKTQLRMNEAGLLSFQHMIKTEDGTTCFVDFLVLPASDDNSDDDEQDEMEM